MSQPEKGERGKSRREFLKDAARLGALGALAVSLAVLSKGECRQSGHCAACPAIGGCALPEANTYRAQQREEGRA